MDDAPGKEILVYYDPENPARNTAIEPSTRLGRGMTEVGILFCILLFPSWLLEKLKNHTKNR